MRKTNTIPNLALQRLRYNKSRTLLTGIAILLTTMLLMAIGTTSVGMLDMNRQYIWDSDYHAVLSGFAPEQSAVLSNHIRVEALTTTETFAHIKNGKMNGRLINQECIKDDRSTDGKSGLMAPEIESGHYPEAEDEIMSSPAFFRRVGAEPVIGGKVTLSFRVHNEGSILTKEFTISGLSPDVEIDEGIDDSRLVWAAHVSKSLLSEYKAPESITAYLRVYGQDELTYDEIVERINAVAADIGLPEPEENIILNKQYLVVMTDPGTETMMIAGVICLVVIVFSALVIYSIYYVGVITDVQEIGKLKALGASRRQIAAMFYCQGAIVSAFAIPLGLLIGYFLPLCLFPLALSAYRASALTSTIRNAADALMGQIHMFSLPVLLAVAAAVVITVCLSLQKPIRMAKRVSPVEAIRYQESTTDKKSRRGHQTVKVSTLTLANLTRNKRRTAVTVLTMGLSCVLFICVSAVLSSVSVEDFARRNIKTGDFRISMEYSRRHDAEYQENNLDSLVQKNYFSDAFLKQLMSIEGVESVEREHGRILSTSDMQSVMFDEYDNRLPVSYFTRDDIPELSADIAQGSIDYDRMTANHEVLCTHVYSFEQYGLSLGDVFPLTLLDGDRKIPLTVTLTALTTPPDSSSYPLLVMTEDTWNDLGLIYDHTTDLYLHVKEAQYDNVKEALTEIVAKNEYFTLYAMDEEMRIGRAGVALTIYPMYLLLTLIAVIGFISLINTMITSIVTRKKELGILQAIGLSDRQLVKMLSGEGLVFTAGTLLISLTLGNLSGYLLYLWAKQGHFMSISRYHYPLWESLGLLLVLLGGQLLINRFISQKMRKESLIERIRNQE